MRKPSKWHPGPRIDKISPAGNAVGLLFVVGTLAIFLVGIPATRYFGLGALAAGLVGAGILIWMRK